MSSKYGKIFNIRVPPQKQPIIDEFKALIKEKLHSDTCFVTTMLIESFVKAHRETPEPTVIRLVRQNITINQNCTNIYGTSLKRARRLMPKDLLSSTELPKCEFCGNPATRRYLYPYHGYIDVCIGHKSLAKRSLGFKDLTKVAPEPPSYELPPTFPLKPEKKVKPKRKRRKKRAISTQKKRKKKINFLAKVWSSVKQFLTKLLWRLFEAFF